MGGVVAHKILETAQSPNSSFPFLFDFGLWTTIAWRIVIAVCTKAAARKSSSYTFYNTTGAAFILVKSYHLEWIGQLLAYYNPF